MGVRIALRDGRRVAKRSDRQPLTQEEREIIRNLPDAVWEAIEVLEGEGTIQVTTRRDGALFLGYFGSLPRPDLKEALHDFCEERGHDPESLLAHCRQIIADAKQIERFPKGLRKPAYRIIDLFEREDQP